MTFSEKLILLRKKNGLSQEQLAEMLEVSRQTVSKWESQLSLPEATKLMRLSDIFGVSVDALLKDEKSVLGDSDDVYGESPAESISPTHLDIMFCTKCGRENRADSRFCGYCGNPFTSFVAATNGASLTKDDVDIAYYKATLQMQQEALELQKQELEELQRGAQQQEAMLRQQEREYKSMAKCPRCGSTSIGVESHKKGYGLIKGITGAALIGPYGLMAGAIGSNKVKTKRICMKCKYRF